ncbi:hypothetical protein V1514DRAFT_366008 [Lipomyces japonicus]|uniref:uncharacterized protein n=1 Tax=Lipomyces japonicus TaxID=56871 RepID=UPI0034CD7ECD
MSKREKKSTADGSRKPITTDPRFAKVHSDPRFALPKKKDTKIALDNRFKNKLTSDKDFIQKRVVDRYGRKVEKDIGEKELRRYYKLEKEDSDDDEEGGLFSKGYDPARGEGLVSSSEEEDDTEEEVDDEDVFEATVEEEHVPRGDESSTFAVVNLDWDNVRADDLMVAFSSFSPPGGKVISVAIYPSEFGKERIAQEEIEGPPREVFKQKKDEDNDDDDEEVDEKTIIKEDSGEDYDSSKLRKYQLQRLRYYYAVVRCDSVRTAKTIYDGCDGTEYEATSNFFDLRYVPEGMTFDDKPRDKSTKVPIGYRPNEFVTDALQHSKVRLTWDETPNDRVQFARRAFSRREIEEMDFKAYLASDSDDDDDDGEDDERSKDKLREKYKALLAESKENTGFDSKEDVDMEITFTPGLSTTAGVEEHEHEQDPEETTIEKYKRKERERKQQRMGKKNGNKAEDDAAVADENKKGKKKGKRSKAEIEEDERRKAELELLMMDENQDESNLKHFDMRDVIKAEKQKKRGKNKKAGTEAKTDDFEINVNDSRFSALYEQHEFAIDPTRPQFKGTEAMGKLLQERRRRQKDVDGAEIGEKVREKKRQKVYNSGSAVSSSNSLTALAAKLKNQRRN